MKIGILTFYYESTNYGGNLQAYALAQVLCSLGYDAEVICYKMENWRSIIVPHIFFRCLKALIPGQFFRVVWRRAYKIFWRRMGAEKKYTIANEARAVAFQNFNQHKILHSEKVYDDTNIAQSIQHYDIFVTGSDQVWNPDCYLKPFYLEFVPPEKGKIAYAASIAKQNLKEKERVIFENALQSFDAVSVREKRGVRLLGNLSPVKVRHVLDPTLLTDVSVWNTLCSGTSVKKGYIFCYFLGTNTKVYKAIKKFAKAKNLKIVNIPHMASQYLWGNERLGDKNVTDAGPEEFLAMIRSASYIFTDSYHAVIFSFLFQKQFFIFNRDTEHHINERIYDLLGVLGLEERFCDIPQKERYQYFSRLEEINYNRAFIDYEKAKRKSLLFLTNSLEKAEKKIKEERKQGLQIVYEKEFISRNKE